MCKNPWWAFWRDPHTWWGYEDMPSHHWHCERCGKHEFATWAGVSTCSIGYCPYKHKNALPWDSFRHHS